MGTAPLLRAALAGLALCVGLPAFAQDDDFDFGDLDEDSSDTEQDDAPKPVEDDGKLEEGDPDDDDFLVEPDADDGEDLQFDDDLMGDDAEDVGTRGPGEDTAKLYREALEEYSRMGPDEEALAWERYSRKYPNSIFKARIEQRLDELNQELYEGKLDASYERTGDAGQAEILFSQPLQLDNIDPRSKIRAGFEWGVPDYINLFADFEWQLMRELSAHAGVRQRFTGQTVEAGARYAIIKSARTQFLLTAIGDFRFNLNPAFPAFRPMLGAGKRVELGTVKIDINAQGGSDLAFMRDSAGDLSFSPRAMGGANIMVMPADNVRAFIETSVYMKGFGREQTDAFSFNQVSVGIQFVGRKSKTEERYSASLGASVPVQQNYWGYHDGSVAGDFNYFL
jgi:hypothetical protein